MVQGVTDSEILVGNSAAVTGIFATTGDPIIAGIRAYFDMVNAAGGIDGRRLRLMHIDDGYDPDKARAAFDRLVRRERVFAYVSHFGAPAVAATLGDIRRAGIPAVGFATGMGELYAEHARDFLSGANCFPIQPIYITEGRAMVVRAVSMCSGKKTGRIGVVYMDDATGNDLMKGVGLECALLHIECAGQKVTMDMQNLPDAIAKLKAADADFLVIAAAQAFFPTVAGELAAQDVQKPAITTYLNSINTIAYETNARVGGRLPLYATSWLNYEGERMQNLEEASHWLGDYAMNGYAHCGWTCAQFFCEGLRRLTGQPLSWEGFCQAMESAPFRIPFGGAVDYAGGQRLGTKEMSLVRLDMDSPTGWRQIDGLKSFDELLHAAL